MTNPPSPGVAPIVMLLDWEGPAINDPAAPAEKSDPLATTAPEVAGAIVSVVLGNGESKTTEREVVSFLTAWRRRYGDGKFDELKTRVHAEIDKQHNAPSKNEALRRAVDQIFDRARG